MMLVLTRKVGEQICVPHLDVVLTVLEVRGRRVQLGIAAPEKIAVVRKELLSKHSPRHGAHAAAAEIGSEESVSSV